MNYITSLRTYASIDDFQDSFLNISFKKTKPSQNLNISGSKEKLVLPRINQHQDKKQAYRQQKKNKWNQTHNIINRFKTHIQYVLAW